MAHDADADLERTPLTDWHVAHGAKMAPFAGYLMPIKYRGEIAEHAAVRERVGLFDITHMGEIYVEGPAAEAWIDGLVTNRTAGIPVGKVVYTAMCAEHGGTLDDMLVYRLGPERWLIVCNGANHAKIAAWTAARAAGVAGLRVDDASKRTALIAVQGPEAWALVARVKALQPHVAAIEALDFYTAVELRLGGSRWVVSRTGYTGERGYEIYVPNDDALPLWQELLLLGADLGVEPIGLAARDTLRFELGYCLYGHELAEDITPLEAGIGWAVKLNKAAFVGRDALLRQKEGGPPRKLIGVAVDGRAIARQGAEVWAGGRKVGAVTSGTFSPTLQRALALALVETAAAGGPLEVDVRGKRFPLVPVPYPFLAARVKGDPRAARS